MTNRSGGLKSLDYMMILEFFKRRDNPGVTLP